MLLTANDRWLQIKAQHLHGDVSFAADVDAAIAYFGSFYSEERLVELWTLKLLLAYRTSLYADADLATLSWLGRTEVALNRARLRPNASERFQALMEIAQVVIQRYEASLSLITEVRQAMNSIEDPIERAAAYCSFAMLLFEIGERSESNAILNQVERILESCHGERFNETLEQFVISLALMGQLDKAVALAGQLTNSIHLAGARTAFGCAYADTGELDKARAMFHEAWECSAAIEDILLRHGVRCDLAVARVKYGEPPLSLFSELLEETSRTDIAGIRVGMVSLIASGLAKTKEISRAQAVADHIGKNWFRDQAYEEICQALADVGQMQRAADLAQTIVDIEIQADTFHGLARKSAEHGQLEWAEYYLQQSHKLVHTSGNINPWRRVEALCAVASSRHLRLTEAIAYRLLDQAEAITSGMNKIYGHTRLAYAAVIAASVRVGDVERAKSLTENTAEQGWQDELTRVMAVVLTETGHLHQAELQLDRIRYSNSRAAVLSALAQACVNWDDIDQAQRWLEAAVEAEQISNSFRQILQQSVDEGQLADYGPDLANKVGSARNEIVCALLSLALWWNENGQAERAQQTLDRAMDFVNDPSVFPKGLHLDGPRMVARLARATLRIRGSHEALLQLIDSLKERLYHRPYQKGFDQQWTMLVAALAVTGKLEEAVGVVTIIQDDEFIQTETIIFLSAILYQRGEIQRALAILGHLSMDDFIYALTQWQEPESLIEHRTEKLQTTRLALQAARIAGWERADWRLAIPSA